MTHLIVIGAQKAGTTTLFDVLSGHPDIATSDVKEINFFSFQFEKGLDWYMRQFREAAPVRLDASPQYLHIPEVADRIRSTLPEAKLVALIRDPISRAVSNYRFNVARGLQDPAESFDAAVRTERGVQTYLAKGLYAAQLAQYEAFASAGRLRLILFDDLVRDQSAVAREVCAFAGIPPLELESADAVSNSTIPVSRTAAALIYRATRLKNANPKLYQTLPGWAKRLLSQAKSGVQKNLPGPAQTAAPSPETRARLVAYFRDDVDALQHRFGLSPPWHATYSSQ